MQTLILQPFGMGDVIWTQTLVKHLSNGSKILWPVKTDYVHQLRRAYPDITFFSEDLIRQEIMETKEKIFNIGGTTAYGIRYAEKLMNRMYEMHMISKYELYGLPWQSWKECAMPHRYPAAEKGLLQMLKIKKDEPFNLIATQFGTGGKYETNIKVNNDYRNINMHIIPGIDLFDWCSVIERAATIHAVSSSTLYLFEILNLAATEVHLYPRKPIEQNFRYVEFLFSKNYILHD